jgi:hypothetical protein
MDYYSWRKKLANDESRNLFFLAICLLRNDSLLLGRIVVVYNDELVVSCYSLAAAPKSITQHVFFETFKKSCRKIVIM